MSTEGTQKKPTLFYHNKKALAEKRGFFSCARPVFNVNDKAFALTTVCPWGGSAAY